MSKYYTPEIEIWKDVKDYEKEYEDINEGGASMSWYKGILQPNEAYIIDQIYNEENREYRVKYLDKEDIESLGFHSEDNGECYNLQIGFDLYGLYPWENNRIHIIKDMKTLFNGVIKNKSELKKLLKQLNINE